jgi:hypothetical protein
MRFPEVLIHAQRPWAGFGVSAVHIELLPQFLTALVLGPLLLLTLLGQPFVLGPLLLTMLLLLKLLSLEGLLFTLTVLYTALVITSNTLLLCLVRRLQTSHEFLILPLG